MESSPTSPRGQQAIAWSCSALAAVYVVVASIVLAVGDSGGLLWLLPGALALAALAAYVVLTLRAAKAADESRAALANEHAALREVHSTFVWYLETLNSKSPATLPDAPSRPEAAEEFERMKNLVTRINNTYSAQRSAVHAAVVSLARRVQTTAHRLQEEAGRMVSRHPNDADVLETSMRVDHAAAQQARYAQSLAALCGERPGQQWSEPLPLSDVVRGAAGRITAYQRVEASGDPAIAVSARAVEPLIHIVAELLANAAQSSPPTTNVLVTLRHVQRGAVIEIDDCGVGMDDRRLEQARAIASGKKAVDLFLLGEVPQTGLASVGTYARTYGFRVDLGESVYGGVRAIVMVPSELTEPLPPDHATVSGQLALTRPRTPIETFNPVSSPPKSAETSEPTSSAPAESTPSPTPRETPREQPQEASATSTQPQEASATSASPASAVSSAPPGEGLPSLPRRKSRRGEAVLENSNEVTMDIPAVPVDPQQSAKQAGQWMSAFLSSDRVATDMTATPNSPSDRRDIPEE